MEVSKIHLSATEYELMQNADIILTKNSVLHKMKLLLEEVQQYQWDFVAGHRLNEQELFRVSPKISKGENYLGLPWLILDYPRLSGAGDLFFIRTMFWWGKFFSSTLHVSGSHREDLVHHIPDMHHHLQGYYLGISDDPWAHHFEEDNYREIASMAQPEFRDYCQQQPHLKIANFLPLNQWQNAPAILFERWRFLLDLGRSVAQPVK